MSYGNTEDILDGGSAPADPAAPSTEVTYYPAATPESEGILRKNIGALAARSRIAAIRVVSTAPSEHVHFETASDDGASATYTHDSTSPSRRLASARRPLDEAQRFAEAIDVEQHATIAVIGFALGHHIVALVDRAPRATAVICFEPDIPLLRAVLERIDCSEWLHRVIVVSDASDPSELAQATKGLEGLMGMGTHIVEHGPSIPRLAETAPRFRDALGQIMRGVRTTMATTMVQIETTMRNLTMNIDHYATCAGIADLHNIASGRPAIVVSAGPSLARNIDLLKNPEVQQRFVIIAVQTVLKQLLAAGIKPHFVTALDRHKISGRFYEGLTEDDVQGVQLVVEPKCNPIIPVSFPGVIRCAADEVLDRLLGEELYRDHGTIKAGATVSHLGYYLARYLGCDPVILVGQDLGFTDNQYYAAGASIHDTWSCELGEFNTLETMEFQRIMRSRQILSKRTDQLGRDIYTEEQLHTYLLQFEREFMIDVKCGRTVIDATEGGVAKANTTPMTLADAITAHMPEITVDIPFPNADCSSGITVNDVGTRLRKIRHDTWKIESASTEATRLLKQIEKKIDSGHQNDANILKVQHLAQETSKILPAYDLVHHLNQTGTFRRVREDRAIELADPNDKAEVQRRQVKRDISNVKWLGDAAKRFGTMLDATINCLQNGERQWDEMPERVASFADVNIQSRSDDEAFQPPHREVGAVVIADFSSGALCTHRSLETELVGGMSVLACTLARIASAESIRTVAVLTDDVNRAQHIIDGAATHLRNTEIRVFPINDKDWAKRKHAIAKARAFAPSSWRGGVGQLCVWDELCPGIDVQHIMHEMALDTIVLVGGDWPIVDPAMIDDVVTRIRSSYQQSRRAFAPAAPGIGPIAIDRGMIDQLVSIRDASGIFATLSATLAYVPIKPQPDPIAQDLCAFVHADVRDLGVRCIADTTSATNLLAQALGTVQHNTGHWIDAPTADIARAINAALQNNPSMQPTRIIDVAVSDEQEGIIRYIDPDVVTQAVRNAETELVAVTLHGSNGIDALSHPSIDALVRTARDAGATSVHVRTRFAGNDVANGFGADTFASLSFDALPDVISAEILSTDPQRADTVLSLAVRDGIIAAEARDERSSGWTWHTQQHNALNTLMPRRVGFAGLPLPWVVARLVKRDATYEDTEPFYNTWLMRTGTAVLDPLPSSASSCDRVSALPAPASFVERASREIMCISPANGDSMLEVKSDSTHSGAAA